MATPEDIIAGIPELSWRTLTAPCNYAHFDVSISQAERRYPYVDGAGHDNTGVDPIKFSVLLYFLNTVEADSFPGNWELWRDALLDGSSGNLDHPILGIVRARVLSWHVEFTAMARAGVVVSVNFTQTRDDLDNEVQYTPADIVLDTAAKQAESECAKFGINYPDGENKLSLSQAIGAFKGSLFSASLTIGGAISQVTGNVGKMIQDIDDLDDPTAWPAHDMLTQVYAGLIDLSVAAQQIVARSVSSRVVTSNTTLDAFATATNNQTSDIMGLNVQALRSPVVVKGTKLFYYSGK